MTTIYSHLNTTLTELRTLQASLERLSPDSSAAFGNFAGALAAASAAAQQSTSAPSKLSSTANIAGGMKSPANSSALISATPVGPEAVLALQAVTPVTNSSAKAAASVETNMRGTPRLLPPGSRPDPSRPSFARFMEATGADPATASALLYGCIGSNTDLRDWQAIMASPTPIADARASTAAMYNGDLNYVSPNAYRPPANQVLAQAGNFAYVEAPSALDPSILIPLVILRDGRGNQLTSASNLAHLSELARNFGFDVNDLAVLEKQLDAANIPFRRAGWPNGFVG